MTLTSSSIRIENTDMPLLGNIEMNPIEIHDSITGNAITFERLCYLPIGLASLEAPPNSTTLHIQDTILIDKLLNDYSNTITNEDISISKICTCESLVLSHNTITNNSSLNPFTIQNNGGQNINLLTDTNISLDSVNYGDIYLNAPNINSYGYSIPICFDILTLNRIVNYTSGSQNWELVWIENANIPKYFFTENPINGYTSSNWRIDVTINTYNDGGGQNNISDKALAIYIDFEDQNTNIYTPIIINKTTPYCRHSNNSTWNGGGSIVELQPYNWTDFVDFSALIGTSSSNLPLKIRLHFTADNPKDFTFNMKVGLTRTNILS